MAKLFKAEQDSKNYYFEVCSLDTCNHKEHELKAQHRSYTWGKNGNKLTMKKMIEEIKALEKDLVKETLTKLPQEGQVI